MSLPNHHLSLLIYIIIFGKFTIDTFLCWNGSGLDLRFLNPVMFAHVLAQPCIEFWENQRKFHFKLVLKELFHTIYELHLLLIVLLPFVTQLQVFRPMGGLTSGVAIMNHPAIAAFLNCEILATSATEPSFFTILLNFFFFKCTLYLLNDQHYVKRGSSQDTRNMMCNDFQYQNSRYHILICHTLILISDQINHH